MQVRFTRDLQIAPEGHTARRVTKGMEVDLPEDLADMLCDNHHAVPAGAPDPADAGVVPGVATSAQLSETPVPVGLPPAAPVVVPLPSDDPPKKGKA